MVGGLGGGWQPPASGGGGGGTPVTTLGGTPNRIAKFITPTSIGDGIGFDNGVSVGFGTITPSASALIDVSSTTQGFLMPRMTIVQRDAIGAPATGLEIYNTDTNLFNYWNGVAWIEVDSGTGDYANGGNAFGGNASIGLIDNFDWSFLTNNITRGLIDRNGLWAIGSSSTTAGARVTITGTGATNATYSIRTFNSTPLEIFSIYNSGQIYAGVGTNLFMGINSGLSITSGAQNTAFGINAMQSITTDIEATAFGYRALRNMVGTGQCTAFGNQALMLNTTGLYNTAGGDQALQQNTTGSDNTAFGHQALLFNSVTGSGNGSQNTAIGSGSLFNSMGSHGNTAVGYRSGLNYGDATNGITAIGYNAQLGGTTGGVNTSVGAYSLLNNQTGQGNIAMGYYAGAYELGAGYIAGSAGFYINHLDRSNSANDKSQSLIYGVLAILPQNQSIRFNANVGINTASVASQPLTIVSAGTTSATYILRTYNSTPTEMFSVRDDGYIYAGLANGSMTIGSGAGFNSALSGNTFIGVNAGANNTGNNNFAIGYNSLHTNTDGSALTAVGVNALGNANHGNYNTAFGANAGLGIVAGGEENCFFGVNTMSVSNGNGNAFFGHFAGQNTATSYNVAIGWNCFNENTGGNGIVAVGAGALRHNTVGYNSTAIGSGAMANSTSHHDNVAIGDSTLASLTSDHEGNIAIGSEALRNIDGNSNTIIGEEGAGAGTGTGQQNTGVGRFVFNKLTNGVSNTGLGYQNGFKITTGSGNLFLGAYAGQNETTNSNLFKVSNQDYANTTDENNFSLFYGVFGNANNIPAVSLKINVSAGVGINIAPTAMLTLPAGTATASTAPLKFTAGTLLATPEIGAMEFTDDGTTAHLYVTVRVATVVTRVQIA